MGSGAEWDRIPVVRWIMLAMLSGGVGVALFALLERPSRLEREAAALRDQFRKLNESFAEALQAKEQSDRRALMAAQLDGATGLPNRLAVVEALERELGLRVTQSGSPPAVLAVHFNSLRAIEKAYGRIQIQNVLRAAASRLQALVGTGGMLGRVSDSDLAFWLRAGDPAGTAAAVAAAVAKSLAEPYRVPGGDTHVSFGIGIVQRRGGLAYGEELIQQACAAAEDASLRASGEWLVFEPQSRTDTIDRLQWETELRAAIAGTGLHLLFQPLVELNARRVAGFEGLLRWQHPLRGLLDPAKFLPVAANSRMLLDVDRWVLRQAVKQARSWGNNSQRDFFISINISAANFARQSLIEEVASLLDEYSVPGSRLRIEIVEGALMQDMQMATAVASSLRELGVRLCLDDFGTGYSSLGYLRALPLDAIKIDRSFTERMVSDSRDLGLVRAIVDIARYLQLSCIVKGVDTMEQHELLMILAPDLVQGHLYHSPLPPEQAEHMLRGAEDPGLPMRLSA
jgi:predicted signal transduction protein with EAL and GGDEF domain